VTIPEGKKNTQGSQVQSRTETLEEKIKEINTSIMILFSLILERLL
jgi:hypothetical protein